MNIKVFLLHARQPDLEMFDDADTMRVYIVRAPDEAIAREQPKRDDSWFANGGKSPWQNSELTKCLELCETEIPPAKGSPEAYTGIVCSLR